MIEFNTKIDFNVEKVTKKINKKIAKKIERVLPIITQQILKDCNYFAPKLTGNLIGSSLLASDFKKGKILYNTKYANRVYWKKRVGKRYNKNASSRWVRKAKAKYFEKWVKKTEKLMKKYKGVR